MFATTSAIRVVHREHATGLGGPRALLLMAADPIAFEGFFASTGALDEPYARLRRTAQILDALTFGDKADAQRRTRRVRAMHAKVKGTLPQAAGPYPAGTPYAADDPALLLWILGCLVDSSVIAFERYVRRLSTDEKDRYWADYVVIGKEFGLAANDMPPTWDAFQDYMSSRLRSPELVVTPRARELGRQIVLNPPLPLAYRPVVEAVNQVTIGLLPARIRREYGLRWDPLRELAVRGGAEYLRRIALPLMPDRLRLVPSARGA